MLVISNLSFSYSKRKILADINITIAEPGIYGIIGSNAVGKSTLLELISGVKSSGYEGSIIFKC